MKPLSALFADVELLMNTRLPNAPVRHVIVVTLLSLACAFCSGCHSRAEAHTDASVAASPGATTISTATPTAPASAGSAAAETVDWRMHAPTAPVDERSITTMETVGAGDV
jgi:hypothetical protein